MLKANVDAKLILDLTSTADNCDLAFLSSGDSDFERAVDLLRSRGKRVYVVTARAVLSCELVYIADKPIFCIEEVRGEARARSEARDRPTGRAVTRAQAPARPWHGHRRGTCAR